MPPFHSASTDQVNALRSGGWAGEIRFAVCQNLVVWQATVNQTITANSFISFLWDNTLAGVRTNTVIGQTFFITATIDPIELRNPILRGRVTQAPSGTTFYCNESAINLTDGMILTVIDSFEILQKDRIGALVDGFQAFEDLAPMVKNMQAFYYKESAVSASFSFAPVGQAMAEGATIASYAWVIAGATYTVGNANTQNITVTVTAGHRWAYLTITDSNGTAFRYAFEILVCLRDDSDFMYTAHDNVDINGSTETGWNVSTTFFAGVEDLLNRTRCAIVAFDIPKSGSAALFNNVVFVGYVVQETTEIVSDPVSSLLSQTSFELQSFAAIAGQLPVPSLPVRNSAAPDEWGDMDLPTPQRTIGYLLTRYSTLANLCAIDMLFTDSTWYAGEMDLEAGTLLDSINRIGQEIQARLVFFPQGDATYEIDADFLSETDRDALPTLLASGNLGLQDIFDYSLPVPYYKTVGQVEAGCATFYTDGSTPLKLTAIAPATARQEGNERPVILAQLLEADLSPTNAVAAAKQRVGDLLEYLNPAVTLPMGFKDGWRILTPSTRVWCTYDLPATDSTRGLPVTPDERYLLQSVSLVWHLEGYWDVAGTARLETRGGLAQQAATISPNQINTDIPILPILSDYDAYPPDGSLNYDTTDPLEIDQQPFDPFDLGQYTPMTTEDAANSAANTPVGECIIISPPVKFSSNVTRTTPDIAQLGATYTITASGEAQLNMLPSSDCLNLKLTQGPYLGNPDSGFGTWVSGEGLGPGPETMGVFPFSWRHPTYTPDTYPVSRIDFFFNQAIADMRIFNYNASQVFTESVSSISVTSTTFPAFFPFNLQIGGFGFTPVGNLAPEDFRVTRICIYGTDETPEYTDPFYVYNKDEDGVPINVNLNPDDGLLVNGLPVSVPPMFNQAHEYTFTYTGEGNQIPFTYYATDYTRIQNVILYLRVCGVGMGS